MLTIPGQLEEIIAVASTDDATTMRARAGGKETRRFEKAALRRS